MSAASAAGAAGRERRIGGRRLVVADDQPTFWDRVEAGRWEPATLAVYDRCVGPGTCVLDLGAWVGPLALYAAALGADVVAVEADPAALEQLRRNLAANPDLAVRITVIDRAVAPAAGSVRLGARRKPGDSMSSALLAGADAAWDAPAVTPPELMASIGPAERLFVKLDIEGGEYALLPALARAIDRPGAQLLVSLHPAILAETGEADPAGRALAALAAFAGWDAVAVGPGSTAAAWPTRETLVAHDAWLLSRPPTLVTGRV